VSSAGSNNVRWAIGGLLLLALAGFFYWAFAGFNWREGYAREGKEPYDVKLLFDAVSGSKPTNVLVQSAKGALDSADTQSAYFFVGETNHMDSTDADAMVRFVKRGGRAIIAAESRSPELNQALFAHLSDSSFYEDHEGKLVWYPVTKPFQESMMDSSITVNRLTESGPSQAVRIEYRHDDDIYSHWWPYFLKDLEPAEGFSAERIGKFNTNHCNVLRMTTGQGELYLLSTPLLLTNYHFRKTEVFELVEPLFSQLEANKIIWDEYNQTYHYEPLSGRQKREFKADEGPLEFILRNRSLSWAWYILLFGAVLYFVAGARRKQRIIPLRDANVNTSVEFAETMSRLYWKHSDHRKIGLLKWQLFITFVRDRYGMRLNEPQPELNQSFVRLLHIKSGVSEAELNHLFAQAAALHSATKADTALLARLHSAIEKFYSNCK